MLTKNKYLKKEYNIMKQKIDNLEQNNIGKSTETKEVFKTINKNCIDIVEIITKYVKSDNISIKSAFRVNLPVNNISILIANLTSTWKNILYEKLKIWEIMQ